jgi:hypothetical protein
MVTATAHNTLALDDSCKYRACGDRSIGIDLLMSTKYSKSNILSLKGIGIGTITSISYYPYFSPSPRPYGMDQAYEQLFEPSCRRTLWPSNRQGFDPPLFT